MSIDANQVLTLTIANLPTYTLLLLGILYNNNARSNDVRDLFRAELKSEILTVRSEIQELRHTMEKNHGDLLRLLADHDHRIGRLEDQK